MRKRQLYSRNVNFWRVLHDRLCLEDVHRVSTEIFLAERHVPICPSVTDLRGETTWCRSRLVVATRQAL